MERIDATYLSSFSFAIKKWKEIKSGFTHFADGDVAMAKITPCFQNRKSMILKGLPNGIGAGTTELKVLRTYRDTISQEYLLFFLESPYFVEEASFKGTANQQRIISGYLENKLFPIPPRKEQDRIVAIIKSSFIVADRYDVAQNKLDVLNASLNPLLKKSILQEAIQGRLVPQNSDDEAASILLERIRTEKYKLLSEGTLKKKDIIDSVIFKGEDNKYYEKVGNKTLDISEEIPFEIPYSWCWLRLSHLIAIISGTSYQKGDVVKSGIRILRGGNLQENRLYLFDDDVFLPGSYRDTEKSIREGDVVIVASTGSQTVIGKPAIIYRTEPNIQIGAFLRILRPYFSWSVKYLNLLFTTEYYREHIRIKAKGTNINNIKAEYLNDILVPLPPMEEQGRIVERVSELFRLL